MLSKVDLLRYFITAARSNSFKEAAEKMGTTPQTVSRSIRELESALGEILFYRNTRSISVTAYGRGLLPKCEAVIEKVNGIFNTHGKSHGDKSINGLVKVTAPVFLGQRFVYDTLSGLLERYPNLSLDLKFTDNEEDFIQSGIDIGVRVGKIDNNNYIAKKIGTVKFDIVISSREFESIKLISSVDELTDRSIILMKDPATGIIRYWHDSHGNTLRFNKVKLISNDSETICKAVCDGIGIAQIPEMVAREYYLRGEMQKVNVTGLMDQLDIYAYRPQSGPVPDRVRLVFDEIVKSVVST
ncbi:LysR family transcriptional regulator [Pectobacterium aroidearum]|uniref:LysR family transcriptional regulator n=1 Tax=Pectobacterium aroidearum TaxID=1201031 RepID=UPI002A81DD3A|nr:LysR family transcriptional regulator [Pectobacterium aroidearum]MDY4388697.1 LysR family transcriptional regulator [Pectobacterium aroidearum]